MKKIILLLFIFLQSCFTSENGDNDTSKADLLIYCGITMIKPVRELAKEFEKRENVKIHITQGGSQNLFNALKAAQVGDLYIPGSDSYRKNNTKFGLLEDYKLLGYNRLALIVKKGNPLGIDNNLKNLTNPNYKVVLGDKDFGSVGRASYKVLNFEGLKEKAYQNAVYLTTDSIRITDAIKKGEADLALNWYATSFWNENKNFIEAIELPKNIAKPKKIEVNLLKFSNNKEIAKKFMHLLSSPKGKEVFYRYGFYTQDEYNQIK